MAKKKPTKPAVEDEEELDDLEDDLLEEDDTSSEDPKTASEKDETSSLTGGSNDVEGEEEEEEPYEIEEEPRFKDYRHLKLALIKMLGDNDYELSVEGQSHGFCNILVRHLLNIEGVKAAAYKITGIVPPQIFIRLEDSTELKIKEILYKVIESLREEVLEVQTLFQKLM
jgi:DNA-directed RNA polymerase subunit L